MSPPGAPLHKAIWDVIVGFSKSHMNSGPIYEFSTEGGLPAGVKQQVKSSSTFKAAPIYGKILYTKQAWQPLLGP